MTARQTLFDNTPVRADFSITPVALPNSARVVIVGGGIAGASIAYHFAKAGWTDVVLLEQNRISSGTTWHAAGMVGQPRNSAAQTKVNKASVELYARLQSESGHDPGWLQCGSLQLARCSERMYQLQRNAAMANVFGVDAEIISQQRCGELWPMMRTDDIVGGVYLPGDGRVLPGECTVALAKSAMQGGVKIIEGVQVERLLYQETNQIKRFNGLATNRGDIQCEWVVLAGNMWMRQIGKTANIDIPLYPCEHHYLITRPMAGVTRDAPCTRDPDAGLYFRALDDGSLKLGAFKNRSKPWQIGDQVPSDFAFSLLEPDWPDFAEPFEQLQHRLRGLTRDDVVKFVNGPEAFTPDNNFIMGQPPLTQGLFVAGGWNSAGIACAGGAGKYTVEWIENGGMTIDLCSVDVRRFLPFQNERPYLQARVSEVLGLHYQMAWPGREMETARGNRASGIYDIHKTNNACFGNTAGWERPLFFAPVGEVPQIEYSFERQNWHDWVCQEVHACRRNVAILDQSTFAKFILEGPEALSILQKLCGRNIDVPVGQAVYTGMFNQQGTFESDLTVVRTGNNSFYVVTATNQQRKDFDWITRHLNGKNATLTDVTEQFNVVSIMGPNAPRLLNEIAPAAFPLQATPYGTVREVTIGHVAVRALRISYVGEEGWELHVDASQAAELYLALMEFGTKSNLRPIGNHAISAMRIEKGFRAYGHELSPDETPLEAGLGWSLDWRKEFLGRDALLEQKAGGLSKRLACFVLKDPSACVLWGGEPILWNGEVAGYTSSACFSPTLDTNIAMGYVRNPSGGCIRSEDFRVNLFEIENLGKRHRALASLKPPLEAVLAKPVGTVAKSQR